MMIILFCDCVIINYNNYYCLSIDVNVEADQH